MAGEGDVFSLLSQRSVLCDIAFDGGLQSATRAALIKELIKYILYEKQQMPSPYETLKHELMGTFQATGEENRIKKKKSVKPYQRSLCILQHRKANLLVSSLEELFLAIDAAFSNAAEHVHHVFILLGATPVTPKEIYCIQLPPPSVAENALSTQFCVRQMFRHLIMYDVLNVGKKIPPTNLMVLLKPCTDQHIFGFHPKSKYKLPQRGQCFFFNILCKQSYIIRQDDDDGKEGSEFNISGIQPLHLSDPNSLVKEESHEEMLVNEKNKRNVHEKAKVHKSENDVAVKNENKNVSLSQDSLWYQSCVTVKGYQISGTSNNLLLTEFDLTSTY